MEKASEHERMGTRAHTHTHTRVSTEFLEATVPPTLLYLENSFTSPGVLTHTTEVYGVV